MWLKIQTKEREIIINLDKVYSIIKGSYCDNTPTIIFMTEVNEYDFTWEFKSEEERDTEYNRLFR